MNSLKYKYKPKKQEYYNEVANISSLTMKKLNLESSLIYIENVSNSQYCDILSLINWMSNRKTRSSIFK